MLGLEIGLNPGWEKFLAQMRIALVHAQCGWAMRTWVLLPCTQCVHLVQVVAGPENEIISHGQKIVGWLLWARFGPWIFLGLLLG